MVVLVASTRACWALKFDPSKLLTTTTTILDRRSVLEGGGAAALLAPLASQIDAPPKTLLAQSSSSSSSSVLASSYTAAADSRNGDNRNSNSLRVVTDPNTYSALAYAPPPKNNNNNNNNSDGTTDPHPQPHPPPLLLVLHGAGKNDKTILRDLADPTGEHAGLVPSLIESGTAPSVLLDNFCVLAPYSAGTASFYGDPRRKLLDFVDWAVAHRGTQSPLGIGFDFDPDRVFVLGFSDGATVAVELLTTRRFAGGVICSYGYSGKSLPQRALDRLAGIPVWVFHSNDDVIFDVGNSDRLVQQLERTNHANPNADPNANSSLISASTTANARASTNENASGSDRLTSATTVVTGGSTTTTTTTTTHNSKNNESSLSSSSSIVRYSRYDKDPEHLPPRIRGHSMGITASKSTDVYEWLLRQGPLDGPLSSSNSSSS